MKIKNMLGAGASILLANLFNKRTPLAVYLSLTDRCPFNCKYCNIPNKKKQKELMTKQVFSLIDEISKRGTQRLHLVGGEPMIRRDIGKIIDYAKHKGLYVTLSSNGFLIPEKINELKNLDVLMLSFDGEKKIHEYHKGKGGYKILIDAIKAAKKHKLKIWTTTVLTKKNSNSKSINFILKEAKKNDFLANFQPLYFINTQLDKHPHLAKVKSEMIMSDSKYRDVIRKLIKEKKGGSPVASSYGFLKYLLNWENFNQIYSKERKGNVKCWAGKLHCYIDTDGSLYPCGDSVGRVKALKVQDVGVNKAFESVSKIPCKSCIIGCDLEQNLIFSLNLKTIINWFKKI